MKKIPLSQNKYAIVDDEDYDNFSSYKWYYSRGYAKRKQKGRTIYMHREVLSLPDFKEDKTEVDHLNGVRYDNRKSNLRACTRAENAMNLTQTNKNNKHGFRGITWHKRDKLWRASCILDGKHHAKYSKSLDEAIEFRKELVLGLHGKAIQKRWNKD